MAGAGLDGVDSVWFGAEEARILSVTAADVEVVAPAQDEQGLVDVEVRVGTASASLPASFRYYTDGDFKAGVVGAVERATYLGGYWSSTPDDAAVSWIGFIEPLSAVDWDLFGLSPGDCADIDDLALLTGLGYLELGVDRIELDRGAGLDLELPWVASSLAFGDDELDADLVVPGASYDLLPVDGDYAPLFSVDRFVEIPDDFVLTSPDLDADSLPGLSEEDLDFTWSGTDDDYMLLDFVVYDSTGSAYRGGLRCLSFDDGAHSVSSSAWGGLWRPGNIVYVFASKVRFSGATLDWNGSWVGAHGKHTQVGAFLAE
ncbi:hypothetical protein L6R53_27985 [Myxococcota bacterium]|nr:hypothetical protein [Myxococcota bacterium]